MSPFEPFTRTLPRQPLQTPRQFVIPLHELGRPVPSDSDSEPPFRKRFDLVRHASHARRSTQPSGIRRLLLQHNDGRERTLTDGGMTDLDGPSTSGPRVDETEVEYTIDLTPPASLLISLTSDEDGGELQDVREQTGKRCNRGCCCCLVQ
jgi:hypothetical protein